VRAKMLTRTSRPRSLYSVSLSLNGSHKSAPLGKSNCLGITPIMTADSPFKRVTLPTISAFPPNWRCDRA
jgi:hypothetical protein